MSFNHMKRQIHSSNQAPLSMDTFRNIRFLMLILSGNMRCVTLLKNISVDILGAKILFE